MKTTGTEYMASLNGYVELLRQAGHTVQLFGCSGTEMKTIRQNAARFLFKQPKNEGFIQMDEIFDP